jgi:hypothetical protein
VVDDPLGHVRGAGDVDGENPQVALQGAVGKGPAGGDANVEHRDVHVPSQTLDDAQNASTLS